MKKSFIVPVLALGLLFSTQAIVAQDSESAMEVTSQDEYVDIAVENLPQPVLDAVANDMAGATITAAAATSDASEYKLSLEKEDGGAVEAYCDAEGNWITK